MGQVIKIGIFYDGGYFSNVTNYYKYTHEANSHIQFSGLNEYIRNEVSAKESVSLDLCKVIDAHYFRGRYTAKDADKKHQDQLYYDRFFEDILIYNRIQPHYLHVKGVEGKKKEKGVDVLFALETFELCMLKRYDVVVIVAGDSDYIPLIQKLHALGTKTVLLAWNFEFTHSESGEKQYTKASEFLCKEVSYCLKMDKVINDGLKSEGGVVREMFAPKSTSEDGEFENEEQGNEPPPEEFEGNGRFNPTRRYRGKIKELRNSYGFIHYPYNNLFFPASKLEQGLRYDDLKVDQELEFYIEKGKEGYVATKITLPGEHEGSVQDE